MSVTRSGDRCEFEDLSGRLQSSRSRRPSTQLSEHAVNLSEAHEEVLAQKKRADDLSDKMPATEKRMVEAEREVKVLKEKLQGSEAELKAQQQLGGSLDEKIRQLKSEKEGGGSSEGGEG